MERGLILDTIALDTTGEIKEGFLFVDVGQGVGNIREGEELPVGIYVVVFFLVGSESGGVFDLIGGAGSSRLKS